MPSKPIRIELRSLRKALDDRIRIAEKGIAAGGKAVKKARTARDTKAAQQHTKTLTKAKATLRTLKQARTMIAGECCDAFMNCDFTF